ncbi:MAG: hypothetical protein KTR35_00145 [Gammaproteobacteria bacterium]|nr:hypothetical protein [Gammaproteobacteria bacterium]
MSMKEEDTVIVHTGSGRRKFIRRGAALLVAGGAISATGSTFADDCDRAAGEKKVAGNGSDSDAGEGADPTGCGKRTPQISQQKQQILTKPAAKIKV